MFINKSICNFSIKARFWHPLSGENTTIVPSELEYFQNGNLPHRIFIKEIMAFVPYDNMGLSITVKN